MMSSKTQPRPILKKPQRSSLRSHPQFFSGNESLVQEDEEDEESACHRRYSKDQDQLIDISNQPKIKTQSCLKKSCLKSHTNRITEKSKSSNRTKRRLSSVYILHSKEVDTQIMKFLLRSFNNFLNDFKASIITELFDDSQLFTTFKDKFLAKLKEYLINGESLLSDQLPACNLGVTLSEPLLSEIYKYRQRVDQEQQTFTSCSELFKFSKENSLDKLDLDNNDNIIRRDSKLENSFCGSLPTTSFFESYTSTLDFKGSVLLKSIRTKPLRTNKDSLLLAHVHEAFKNKQPTSPNKSSIVSKAENIKKAVRFADTFGLELEKVKLITNNSFVEVFSQQINEEKDDDQSNDTVNAISSPFLVLIPLFSVRKQDTVIRLEDYIYDYENKIIKCIIRVKNLAFEKKVFSRISVNNWKSFYDLDSIYIRSDKNKDKFSPVMNDYFGFCVVLPDRTSLPTNTIESKPFDDCTLRVEFALCCIQNGISYWDNNSGENYKFQCFYNKTN